MRDPTKEDQLREKAQRSKRRIDALETVAWIFYIACLFLLGIYIAEKVIMR